MIQDLAEFEKLLKICRKQGVKSIQLGGVVVAFGDLPKKSKASDESDIETDELTPEQLMFYSSGGPIHENQQA